ncbi:Cytochrome P450 superfamily [Arabidopsis suecica]|uniref:Cytochrome P450 superfamily n=1 Tax=Arabidopsis suecica TaxID=45249 RepID=A0A8T2BFD3_ARASU|nr:Cytochrome P450 superfamily [Arabidopsis suecica]
MATMITAEFQSCFIFLLLCLFSLLCYSLLFRKPSSRRDAYDCDLPPSPPSQHTKLKDSQVGRDLPQSPPSLPIIGHLHHLISSLSHKSLQKLSSKYGPLLYLSIFNFPVVLVSSASVAYEIFKAHDLNISSRDNPPIDESLLVGSSVFVGAPYGDYWKFMKKLLVTKLLGPQALEQSRGIRADELERFYRSLLDKAMKKESVEIGKEATKLSINSICRMSMGRSFSEESGEAERVRGLVTELDGLTKKVLLVNILRWPLEKLGISLFKKEIMYVSNSFDELLERILVEHEEKPDKHQFTDLMDVLLEAYADENAEHKITRNHIKSLFVELFLGGTDTSAQTIQWIMAEIINNPNILERLREEIDSVLGKTRLIQETDLPNLPDLQSVVKEGLRLHPPLPLMVRTFQRSCDMKGFYIPEKTTLVVNAYAVMRDPTSWEDPDEFKPERFLRQEEERRGLNHIAFGSGRRGCPGSNLATIIIGTAVGTMVQCFDLSIKGDKVKMDEAGGLNLTMAHPLECTLVPRTNLPFSNLQVQSL